MGRTRPHERHQWRQCFGGLPNKALQLTPNSWPRSRHGGILAAAAPSQRWRSALFGAAERRSVRRQTESMRDTFLVLAFVALTTVAWSATASAVDVCNCKGNAAPGGPCYAGPGGPAYSGAGGPAYAGPGGPCYAGPGGPRYDGPGGPSYDGPGGPRYTGPGGPAYDGPGGPAYDGPGGPCYAGAGGPCYSGPGGTGERCPAVCR